LTDLDEEEMARQSLPNNVNTHVESFDLNNNNNNASENQRKSFNWLTGAAMTQKNVEKLADSIE